MNECAKCASALPRQRCRDFRHHFGAEAFVEAVIPDYDWFHPPASCAASASVVVLAADAPVGDGEFGCCCVFVFA
jgi:hypothetical protein